MLPDFGWTELLVIAIVLIVVVGPKDLPRVVRGFSKSLGSMRKMAGDFRKQFDEALADAELDDLKTLTDDVKSLDPRNQIKEALNPLGEIGKDINDELKGVAKSIEEDAGPIKREITPQEAYPQLAKTAKETKAAESKTAKAKKAPTKKTAARKPATKVAKKTTAKAPVKNPTKASGSNAAKAKAPTKKPAATRSRAASSRTKTTPTKKVATAKKPAVSKAGEA